jgi:hypothetical protein
VSRLFNFAPRADGDVSNLSLDHICQSNRDVVDNWLAGFASLIHPLKKTP